MSRSGLVTRGSPLALLRSVAGGLATVIAVGLLWKAVLAPFGIPAYIMPPPDAVATSLADHAGQLAIALALTLRAALLGLLVAFCLAILLAALFVGSRRVTRAVLPVVIGLRTAPVLAIAPILIMIFGRGLETSIAVVVIVSFFPVMVNAMKGFSATPRHALELMHVLGAGWLKTMLRVRLPFALPFIFTGLRSASTSAVLAAMLAEWLSGAPGLGSAILDASSFRKTALMWAAVVVSVGAGITLFAVTAAAERRLLTWRGPG